MMMMKSQLIVAALLLLATSVHSGRLPSRAGPPVSARGPAGQPGAKGPAGRPDTVRPSLPTEPPTARPTYPSEEMLPEHLQPARNSSSGGDGLLIVNGDDADPGEWPHQAQLLYGGSHRCGGSLVHGCYVLTARHCVTGLNPAHLKVRLGEHNRLDADPYMTEHNVFKVITHPTADVALLVISPGADESNERIATIGLATVNPAVGTLAMVTGWGQTESLVSGSLAYVLQEVEIPIADPAVCDADLPGTVAADEICAGTATGEYANACHGDSGGPLVVQISPGVHELVGVVSWGNAGCPSSHHYAVYVSVAVVRDWIMHYLPPPSSSPGPSCACALPATKHDGSPVPATFDGVHCYLGPARQGCDNSDEETKSFIYENRYYIKSSAAVLCPVGTFDSCNCYRGPKPVGGFIHDNKYYQTVPPSGVCPPGTTYDGANCYIASAPWATSAFIYDGNFYSTARKQCAEPAEFTFDGANCLYEHAPCPNPLISDEGYYCDKVGGSCPPGSIWDGVHCYWRKAPWATTPFLWEGSFYATPRRQCYEGSFDSANCLLMTPPTGASAFLHDHNYYYTW